MIELHNVSKVFKSAAGEVRALQAASCCFEPGEFVAIVGPSGSGKSTLMLTAGALMRPTKGRVLIDGVDVYSLSPGQRARLRLQKIGFLFQTFNLIEYLTAEENVQVALSLGGLKGARQYAAARELLIRVGLKDRLRHLPGQLSVGEKQRVALARCMANKPSFILADEPTGNLDPLRTDEIIDRFQELVAEGITVVMVTHNYTAAARASRHLKLEEGRLEALSQPPDLVTERRIA